MSWVASLIERLLEQASARAQADSPRAREILAEINGKVLAIEVLGTGWVEQPLYLACDGRRLMLASAGTSSAPPDAVLSGAPLSLLGLLRSDWQAPIRRGDVSVRGDLQLAQRCSELGRLLAPDLEHNLAQLLGRSTAHVLMRGLRAAADSARQTAWTSLQNMAEYLAHESGDLVSRPQAAHFTQGVEQAREQLDRLEVRMARLEQRARDLAGGAEPA